jgi:Taurine catabolism dioxygenase TauD, TfdA family
MEKRLSARETEFVEQRYEFYDKARNRYPSSPTSVEEHLVEVPRPLRPVFIDRLDEPTEIEALTIGSELTNGFGVAHVVPLNRPEQNALHPVLRFAERLRPGVDLGYPVEHPMEKHPEAQARFGNPDGTLKIYDLPMNPAGPRYREQAETNEMFDSHNDGLGYAGLIARVIFSLDSAPLVGGYTYFQNLVRSALAIAGSDEDAFRALFLPDAIVAIRPRGKGAIKVTAPALYLGRDGEPQTFFRITTGEYQIEWRDLDSLHRAQLLLERLSSPFAPGSQFVHLMQPGETIVIDNRHVVHGRTPFVDRPGGPGRVLARKWFVADRHDTNYRHVPSVYVDARWSGLYPEQFSEERLTGDWHFDQRSGENAKL